MINSPLFPTFPQLQTRRLILRQITPDDVQAVFAIFSDSEVTRYHDSPTYTTLEEALGWIERRRMAYESGRAIRWGVARKEDSQLLGACGLGAWDREATKAEVGYELAQRYWGQGFMTEALQAIVHFGFETMGLHRIEAEVMLDNASSCRLLDKIGFQAEGILAKRGFWKGASQVLRLFALEPTRVYSSLDSGYQVHEGE